MKSMESSKSHHWVGKEVTRAQSVCLKIGHALALVSLVLIVVWCSGNSSKDKMLGGLSVLFNYHPICMVLGMLVCMGGGAGAFRTARLGRSTNKRVHVVWHTAAIVCVTIGLRAVWISHERANAPNLYTIHGILGFFVSLLFYAQYLIAALTFLTSKLSKSQRERILEMHVPVGILLLLLATAAIVSGIAEKMAWMKCTYYPRADATKPPLQLHKPDSNPAIHFTLLPLGCRVAIGVGISAVTSATFLILGILSLKVGRESDHLFSSSSPAAKDSILLPSQYHQAQYRRGPRTTTDSSASTSASYEPSSLPSDILLPGLGSAEDSPALALVVDHHEPDDISTNL